MRNKKISPILVVLASPLFCLPMILTSCGGNTINIANFESYMSDDVIDQLKHDQDIKSSLKFLYYATNEDIETKFKRYYDIAIPSSYEAISLLMKNQLEKIDWTKFNLKQIDQNNDSVQENELVENGNDAMTLFDKTAQEVLEQATDYVINSNNWPNHQFPKWFSDDNPDLSKFNILDYAIPYFLQDWVFAYKNTLISGLNDDCETYNDIFNIISPHSSSFNDFFKPSKTRKIGMIEDSRTVYDFSKLISTEQHSQGINPTPNINPTNEKTIEDFEKTYQNLTSKFDKQYFWLNSDSGQMNIALATPLNDGGLNSVFTYNGDILYAAMGSDLNAGIDEHSSKYVQYFDDKDNDPNVLHMHFIRPNYVPAMMDMMVINKNSTKNKNANDIYNIVKKVCLDSANIKWNDSDAVDKFNNTYSFQNWSYILYTNSLYMPDKYIKDKYFEDNFDNWHLLKNIYSMNDESIAPGAPLPNLIEAPISDMDKSNMYWAFIKERENL